MWRRSAKLQPASWTLPDRGRLHPRRSHHYTQQRLNVGDRRSNYMDEQAEAAKKTALLMIPYGLYVLGAREGDEINAGTVNWVTQCSFQPPLVAIGVKRDSHLYAMLQSTPVFSLSFLESGQKDLAFAFFRPAKVEGDQISG